MSSVAWNSLEWAAWLRRRGAERHGVDGVARNGMAWNGVEWNSVGVEQRGVGGARAEQGQVRSE